MSSKTSRKTRVYESPLHYKELFDLTKKGLENYVQGKDVKRNRTRRFSFLYLYILFNPSTRKEIAENLERYMDEYGAENFYKFSLKSVVASGRVVRDVDEMKKRGLILSEGNKPEILFVNPEPLFSKHRWMDIPFERKKELWGLMESDVDWLDDDSKLEYEPFKERCWIDDYLNLDFGRSGFKMPDSAKSETNLEKDGFITTIVTLSLSKLHVKKMELLDFIFELMELSENFGYRELLHTMTLVLNKVRNNIPSFLREGESYGEGKPVVKMEHDYERFFLNTKDYEKVFCESFKKIVGSIENLKNEHLNRVLVAKLKGKLPSIKIKDNDLNEYLKPEDIILDLNPLGEEVLEEGVFDFDSEQSLVSKMIRDLKFKFYDITGHQYLLWERMYFSVAVDYLNAGR